jgi:hypothetical protein
MKWAFLPWVGFALLAGCHHAPPTARIEGSSAFSFVEPPPPPQMKPAGEASMGPRQPEVALLVAAPIEPLAKPVYPPTALGREKMPVLVGIHFTVDAAGCVTDTRPSLAVISTPTPRMEEFRAAVEAALAQWRFRPAELRRFAPATDLTGAPAWVLASSEKTDCTFDVSFVFQATGEVESGGVK